MIQNKRIYGGLELEISRDLAFGVHVINQLKENCNKADRIALINGKTEEQITYSELLCKISCISKALAYLDIKPGDVVGVCCENCVEHIAATVATSAAGAVVTFLNTKYSKYETQHALNISKPSLMFCSKTALDGKLDVFLQTSCINHIIQLSGEVTNTNIKSLADLEERDRDIVKYEARKGCGNATAFIFYSSGTTGLPKGVMLTHYNVLHATAVFNCDNKNAAKVLTIIPWNHVYGLLTTIQYLISGNLVVFLPEYNPELFLASIEKYQIEEMPSVPPMIHVLAKSPLVHNYDLSSVQCILCAAAPLSADTIENALTHLPNCKGIFQAYGMTETTMAILKEPFCSGRRSKGSCGKPLPGVIGKVVDVNTRERLGPDVEGEICFKGPTLMQGYIDNEAATKDMFDEEGYLKSGDIGYYDEDGAFYVVDRLKEILKYKGHQVAPAAVESVLLQHAGVAECGVVGAPDERAGELPTAFVVRKPGADLTEEELLQFTSTRLSPMSKLRGGIIFAEEIPKNGSGKILRRDLRNKLMELKKAI